RHLIVWQNLSDDSLVALTVPAAIQRPVRLVLPLYINDVIRNRNAVHLAGVVLHCLLEAWIALQARLLPNRLIMAAIDPAAPMLMFLVIILTVYQLKLYSPT